MQEDLPYWLKVLAALSTPAIAVLGLTIAWAQWATARSKLVLDLHDQRVQAHAAFQGPIGEVLRSGGCTTKIYFEYCLAAHGARFLFGDDVVHFLDQTGQTLNRLSYATTMLHGDKLEGDEHSKHVKLSFDCITKISGFWTEFDRLALPYMLMDQKLPWSPRRLLGGK